MKLVSKAGRFTSALAVAAALASGSAMAAKTVAIGYTGPLSGGAALYGQNTLSGMQMAAEEINAAGGYDVCGEKVNFEIVALDDKYSPSEAGVNAKRLVQQNKTPIVFTPHSGGAFALQAFNERDGFILASYTSIPEVTERGNKLTVRIPPNFKEYVEPFTNYEMNRFGKNLGIANATHTYAKLWTQSFVPAWEEAGGKVVADNPMDYNRDTDFYSGVSRVLAEKPDVLFIGGASEPTALVAKQARQLGFKGGFVVMDQAKLDEMANVIGGLELLEGSVGVMPLVYSEEPAAKEFVSKYEKYADKTPGSEAGYHYFATYLFAEAMNQACSTTDAGKIRANVDEALEALPEKYNVLAVSGISEGGALESDLQIAAVENGKIVPKQVSELAKKK